MTSTKQELINQFKKHLPDPVQTLPASTSNWLSNLALAHDKFKEYLDPNWIREKLIPSKNQVEFYRRLWELCFCSTINEAGDYSLLSIPGRDDSDRGPDFLLQSPSDERFYVECVVPCPSKNYVKLLNQEPCQNDIDNILDENLIAFSYINDEWVIYFCNKNAIDKHKVINTEVLPTLEKIYFAENSLNKHNEVKNEDDRILLRDCYELLISAINGDPDDNPVEMQSVKKKSEFQRKVMSSIKTKQEGEISGWAGNYKDLPLVIAMCVKNLPNSFTLDYFYHVAAGCFYPVNEFWATIEGEKMSLKISKQLQTSSVISGAPIEKDFFLQKKYREISAVVFYPNLSCFKAVQVNNCNALYPFNDVAPHVQLIIDFDEQKQELQIKETGQIYT